MKVNHVGVVRILVVSGFVESVMWCWREAWYNFARTWHQHIPGSATGALNSGNCRLGLLGFCNSIDNEGEKFEKCMLLVMVAKQKNCFLKTCMRMGRFGCASGPVCYQLNMVACCICPVRDLYACCNWSYRSFEQ